jgi:hypothetical protein
MYFDTLEDLEDVNPISDLNKYYLVSVLQP